MTGHSSSRLVVYAALSANLLIALTKLGAAGWTGSSAMLSEAVHSFVDTGNQAVLLYGIHRAGKPADETHPLGYGRELYFWSFIVALLMFTVGAGVTLLEGIRHIRSPEPIVSPWTSYVVLGLSAVFEGASWTFALREFRKTARSGNLFKAVRRSKDPTTFMVLFEDSAALAGLLIAFIGTFAAVHLDAPVLDGAASIGISILLGGVALLLASESKQLLIGEPASPRTSESILSAAKAVSGIVQARLLFTVHLSPNQIVAALSLEFDDALTTPQIERKVREIERNIHAANPDVFAVLVKPQSLGTYAPARRIGPPLKSTGP